MFCLPFLKLGFNNEIFLKKCVIEVMKCSGFAYRWQIFWCLCALFLEFNSKSWLQFCPSAQQTSLSNFLPVYSFVSVYWFLMKWIHSTQRTMKFSTLSLNGLQYKFIGLYCFSFLLFFTVFFCMRTIVQCFDMSLINNGVSMRPTGPYYCDIQSF